MLSRCSSTTDIKLTMRLQNCRHPILRRLELLERNSGRGESFWVVAFCMNVAKIMKRDRLNFPDSFGIKFFGLIDQRPDDPVLFGFRNKQGILHRNSGESVRFVSKASDSSYTTGI
jgi:hypothetical protein